MAIRLFNTYKEASGLAKSISTSNNVSITLGRKGTEFFVDIPDGLEPVDEPQVSNIMPPRTEPTHKPKVQHESVSKPNISYKSKPVPLKSRKQGILEAIDSKKLSYDQSHQVWQNKASYNFTPQEELILESYKDNVKPYTAPKACQQCGMVGDNCTCNRSWF